MTQHFKKSIWLIVLGIVCALFSFLTISSAETDITGKIELIKSRLSFDRRTSINYLDVSLKNTSQDTLLTPMKAVIDSISAASVTVANPDGMTSDGKPYFEYSVALGELLPGATTDSKRWEFDNSQRARFTYTVEILGDIKVPPAQPTVSINSNPATVIEGESITLSWTSTDTDSCEITPGLGTFGPSGSIPLTPDETTTYTITATGAGGSAVDSVTVTVNPPPEAPTVDIEADPMTIQEGETSTLSWISTNADTCEIVPDIGIVDCNDLQDVSPASTIAYTITVSGAGGVATDNVTIVVESSALLPIVNITASPQTIQKGDSTILSWLAENVTSVYIDHGIGLVSANDTMEVSPASTSIYTITATGPEGSASAQVMVTVESTPTPLPEGSFGKQYENIIPPDATIEEYDSKRFSLITGYVNDVNEVPLADVLVAIDNHPEYGTTKTNMNGQYSLPVEGGGTLNVIFSKDGLLTAHRKVNVPWNDIAIVETITMIAEDTKATTFTFDSNPNTVIVHESTPVTDESGTRRATMVFTGDNKAYAVDEYGNDMFELNTITTRATEYTTPESMPAVLPPTSAFTYCAELKVDGVERVRFDKPIVNYVDNFLGFDVGEIVPVGYYDRDRGVWVPSENGVVVKLLDTNSDGVVDALDADGDDVEDDLDGDGFFDDEVLGLNNPAKYVPGTTYWRFSTKHFSPWDCNWPFGIPVDAITWLLSKLVNIDQQTSDPCKENLNSYATCRSRVYHEDIPVSGTGLTLHYASNRTQDYKTVINVPVTDDMVPDSLKSIIVRLTIAGQVMKQTLDPLPNQQIEFLWDGLNYLGNRVGTAIASVEVGFVYDNVYQGITSSSAFGSTGTTVTGVKARNEITLWEKYTLKISSPSKAKNILMEGWALSNHHGENAGKLYTGDGRILKDALINSVYSGLIAYYPFDGNANDEGGYSNDGTVSGAIMSDDRFGQENSAYEFDGVNDYINIGNQIRPSLPVTFSMWIYPEGYQTGGLISLDDPPDHYFGPFMEVSGTGGVEAHFGSGRDREGTRASSHTRNSKSTGTVLPLHMWTHIVGVIRGRNNMDIYINGINVGGAYSGDAGAMYYSNGVGYIGVVRTWGNYFKGKMDDVRVYDRDLPEEEMNSLMTSTSQEKVFVEDGFEYVMSETGLHKETRDLDTGVTLETFGYDSEDRLVSITDNMGNVVTVERDGDGVPTAIISPDGVRNELTVDTDDHLTRIEYPDSTGYDFEYTLGGLMTKETEPNGNYFTHTFDANGRLTDAYDQEEGHKSFARTVLNNGDIETTVTTAEGNITTYLDHTDTNGTYSSTITDPDGLITDYTRSADELTVNKVLPDGTVLDFQYDYDPEYKTKYIKEMSAQTPAGLIMQTTSSRTYTDTNTDGAVDHIERTVTVNGKTSSSVNDTLTSQITQTSPLGRAVTTTYDPATLLTSKVSAPGLLDTDYLYYPDGRLQSVTTGTRQTQYMYDSDGNVQSIEDPLHKITTFEYDAVGRTTAVHRPDSTDIHFTYDLNGNMTVLTNPKTINHGYIYNKVNGVKTYDPPLSADYAYTYDKDRRLLQKTFPSGKIIKNIYTNTQLTQIQTPEGNVDMIYFPSSGQLQTMSKSGESVTYGYDGALVTSKTLAGTLNQALSYAYNNDFQLTGFTYSGDTAGFGYDNDGLLTSASGFTIIRNANNGLPESVDDGVLNLGRTFNGYGELENQAVIVNSLPVTNWSLTYNDNGQISAKTETVAGVTADYSYEYDAVGRLTKVYKDSTLVEEYAYNNGIRSLETNILRGISGKSYGYNDEDQLLTAGSTTYQYDDDGFLRTKVEGISSTTYDYSSRGELLEVALPGGNTIKYVHDPLGRRIAKQVNSVTTEKYLWDGLTQLLAVYNGSNNLLMRFEYADARMPFKMVKGGSAYYLTYDQVGSLRVVTDASGAVVKRIDYDSFGNIINDSAPSFEVPFGFAGGLHDRDTGLVRFGFRDYDPEVGRWTAKDPIGFDGGDWDLYAYTLGDPVNFVDPMGLEKWLYIVAGGSGGLGLTGGGGEMILVNITTGEYHRWFYGSVGVGPKGGAYVSIQVGIYETFIDPEDISQFGFSISGFAAAGQGVAGQISGTGTYGEGELGGACGIAGGIGAGISPEFVVTWGHEEGTINPPDLQDLLSNVGRKFPQLRNFLLK